VRIATLRGVRCVEYRPSAAGGERPLAGLLDLLPHLLALPGAVGCSPPSYGRLSELARGVQSETTLPEDRADSTFRFAMLRRSVLDLVEAVLTEGEVLIAVDDAHALRRPAQPRVLVDATRPPDTGSRFRSPPGGSALRPHCYGGSCLADRPCPRLCRGRPSDRRAGAQPEMVAERSG
jgi:hypothetical protein